jgi:osmotically-inducible protein OsmY
MSTRYGDRGHGRYGDPEEERTEDRDYAERDTSRRYGEPARGEAGERYGREYGAARRGGYAAPRGGGGDYGGGRERGEYGAREYDSRDYFSREYGARRGGGEYGPREYGGGEYGPRYGREAGGYPGPAPARRHEGEDYGRGYAPREYGRDAGRDAGRDYERVERAERVRPRPAHDDEEGVRDYDTDYGRTTSRFYGRSGYEYGREDYDRDDDDRDERRGYAVRGEERGNWLDRAADQVRSWFGGEEDERGHHGRRDEMRARGGGDGKFRGRGPKNYRRSDDRVREEVCDHLTDNEWLDASDVEVNVVAGEVILTGTVDSRYAKRLAENIAESVAGVANVQNNLRVLSYQTGTDAPPPTTPTTAGELTAASATTDTTVASSPDAVDYEPDDSHAPPAGHSTRAAGGGS